MTAQVLTHMTLDCLTESIFSEIEQTTLRLIDNNDDTSVLRGEIIAYRRVLRMLKIPDIRLSVMKGEVKE